MGCQCSSLMICSPVSRPLAPSLWFFSMHLTMFHFPWNISFTFAHHPLFKITFTLFSQGFSPDASLLLFATDVENIWRHSFTARFGTGFHFYQPKQSGKKYSKEKEHNRLNLERFRYLVFDPMKNSTWEVLGKGEVNNHFVIDPNFITSKLINWNHFFYEILWIKSLKGWKITILRLGGKGRIIDKFAGLELNVFLLIN